jgi:hypothetical protein
MARPKKEKIKQQIFDPKDLTGFDWDDYPWGQIPWKDIDWDDLDIGDYTNLCPDKNHPDFEYGSYLIAKSAQQDVDFNKIRKAPSKIIRELDHLIEVMDKLSLEARAALDSASRSERFRLCLEGLMHGLDDVPDLFSPDLKVRYAARSRYPSAEAANEARLKQAEEAFGRFSPEAKAQLEEAGRPYSGLFNGGADRMKQMVSSASESIKDGKKTPDRVRERLGSDAWAIWAAHGGDIEAEDFVVFLDRLIDATGLNDEGGGKARISADTLAHDIRGRAKSSKPPSWQLWSDE